MLDVVRRLSVSGCGVEYHFKWNSKVGVLILKGLDSHLEFGGKVASWTNKKLKMTTFTIKDDFRFIFDLSCYFNLKVPLFADDSSFVFQSVEGKIATYEQQLIINAVKWILDNHYGSSIYLYTNSNGRVKAFNGISTEDITDAVSQPQLFKAREFGDWKFLISLSNLTACTFFNKDRLWAVKKFMKLKGIYRPMSYIQCSTSELIDTTPLGVNVNAVNMSINEYRKRIDLKHEFKSIKELAINLPAGTKFYYDEDLELFINGKHIKSPRKDSRTGKVVIQGTEERAGYVVSEDTPDLIAQCLSQMVDFFPNKFCGRLVDGDYFTIVKVLKSGQTYGRLMVDKNSIRYSEVEDCIYFESSVSKEVRK